ncbi:MAG: TetR family transcriptional regulator [Erysipelotrichia bacterium]|nr:TetR family transcriptional regulator [Erysipelotrichia bacterium]
MQKNEQTKYKFTYALIELIKHKPLDKITVADISEKAKLTRQTFYRNFKDKFDLVNWYFEKLCMKSFKEMGISCTLKEGLIKKFTFIKSEREFFSEAFLYEDCNSIMQYDYECIYDFYRNVLMTKMEIIEPDLDFLLRMYCRGSIEMTVEWVRKGMKQDIENIVDLLIEALPKRLEVFLLDLE